MPERRELSFAGLDQVMPDVERLLPGCTTVGNWSLGQICNHLTRTVRMATDGAPRKAPWIMRKTLAPIFLWKMMRSGKMPAGIQGPPELMPPPGLDDRAECESLREALKRYQSHAGPYLEHPFFGNLSREAWDKLNCIHCAHHLSFALPKTGG